MRARIVVADGSGQIAAIGDFDQCQAGMLFMIGAQSAVVRTPLPDRRVELLRHLARLVKLRATAVILRVGRDQHLLPAMLRTPFLQVNVVPLDQHLRFDIAKPDRADAVGQLVKEVGAIGHENNRSSELKLDPLQDESTLTLFAPRQTAWDVGAAWLSTVAMFAQNVGLSWIVQVFRCSLTVLATVATLWLTAFPHEVWPFAPAR